MAQNEESINPIYISLISFSLTILSKISDNSFITLVLLNKNTPPILLYISSLLSSFFLNFLSISIGYCFRLLINIDIIINYFVIIIFILYGFISLIVSFQILKNKEKDDKNKLIEDIMNNSSDEDSERAKLNIKPDKNNNDIEFELDNLNNDGSISNDNNLDDKENNKIKNVKNFWYYLISMISVEVGEKIQIVNISLEAKYQKWIFLILGNFLGNVIINIVLIFYGVAIVKNKINNIVLVFESLVYLVFAFCYLYLSYFDFL